MKERLLWLPASLKPQDSDLSIGQAHGPFKIAGGGVDEMMGVIHGILGLRSTAAILYQDPGANFVDIETWALTRFAEAVELKEPKIEAESYRHKLKEQLIERLLDGDKRFIVIACDGTISAPNQNRENTRLLFKERLRIVERAIREAVQEVAVLVSEVNDLRFVRVFLQYRHPNFTFEDFVPNPYEPRAKWMPVRFKDLRTPCDDCLRSVRDEIQRVCA